MSIYLSRSLYIGCSYPGPLCPFLSYLSLPVEEKLEVKKNFYEEKYPIQHRSKAAKFTVFSRFFLGGGGAFYAHLRGGNLICPLSPIWVPGSEKSLAVSSLPPERGRRYSSWADSRPRNSSGEVLQQQDTCHMITGGGIKPEVKLK